MRNRLPGIVLMPFALAACTMGGLFGGGDDARLVTPATENAGPALTLNAEGLVVYLETMQALVEGDPVRQAEVFREVERATSIAPTTTNRLRMALALASPHGGGRAPVASVAGGSAGGVDYDLPGWLRTEANTGIAAHGLDGPSLDLYTGSTSPSNTTITEKRITSPHTPGANVTYERCYFAVSSFTAQNNVVQATSGGNCQIIDCLIDCTGIAASSSAFAYAVAFKSTASVLKGTVITGCCSGRWAGKSQ